MTDLLYRPGTYHRRPDGAGNEAIAEQKAAGIEWALFNIGGDVGRDPQVWDSLRARYRQAGIPTGPWLHIRSMTDLEFLLGVAVDWQSEIIGPNVEDVVGDNLSLREIGGYLLDFWVERYGKPVHMATLPWLQNGQGWEHVAFAYLALELFPKEAPLYTKEWAACIDHAFREGARRVTLLYSTTSPRATYPNIAHCLYTADDVTDWRAWDDDVPQVIPQPPPPPIPPEVPMLTDKQFPYTGPLFGPGDDRGPTRNRATIKGLKRGMIRLGHLNAPLGSETDDYGAALEAAIKKYQRREGIQATGQYGRGTWLALRGEVLPEGPNAGAYAMDALALRYVREDDLDLCYPHPLGALSDVCQDLHPTAGLAGNWAIDFCAPGGTPVVAVERATIKKLSGRSPSQGADQTIGIYGWSIHYESASGRRWFSTHYGTRKRLTVGQIVDCGQVLGTVGSWPDDPGRSHTHLGVTSPLGTADAKKWITAVSKAKRVTV